MMALRRRMMATLAALALAASGARAEIAATGVTLDGDEAAGVVTVTFDASPAFSIHKRADPPRVIVDLPLIAWRAAPPAPQPGLGRGVRFGLAAPGRSRLVIDLAGPARVAGVTMRGGVLTMTLEAVNAARFVADASPPGASPSATSGLTVAIDPGHGGVDPGAIHGALVEKNITLAFARALREALSRRGRRAILTREEDAFLTLDARVAAARAAGADVMVSVHADAAPQPEVAGASVYTLSARSAEAAVAALASAGEGGAVGRAALFPGLESDVARLLAPRVRRETAQASARLGAALLDGLAAQVAVLPGRPLRAASFQVLRAPDIPAALIELGFLSNAEDRARLTDPAWIDAAAQAIAAGLDAWTDAAASHKAAD